MCGIFAEWRRDGGVVDAQNARRRLDLMAHRGPDGDGLVGWSLADGFNRLTEGAPATVALGHRRLAIIDLGQGGAQPMLSPDRRFALTYNGEIYNYLELRDELRARHGWSFRGGSDTEVLLAAWQTWGEAALDRLDGMYAFVLLDAERRRLTAVRDPFGIKPLHYVSTPTTLRLASEIRPLIDGATPSADTSRLFDYLRWGAVDEASATLFAGVSQLEPGQLMNVDLATDAAGLRRFWTSPPRRKCSEPGDAAALRDRFVTAVNQHTRADVPIAATLSGGLDSSAICSVLRAIRPDQPIHVFSYAASGAQSEERWIDLMGEAKSLCVEKVRIHEDEVLEDLSELIKAQEQPFGSGSIYAQYKIFEAIGRRGYKVMLDGQGADEILGGYKSFVAFRVADLVAEGRLGEAVSVFRAHARRDPGSARMVARRLLRRALPSAAVGVGRRVAGAHLDLPFARCAWFTGHGVDPREAEARQVSDGLSLHEVLARSVGSTVLPSLLRYADRNAMAFSVENRVPFLSRPLVEMAASLPPQALISDDGRTKAILRDALADDLPAAIRDRHDKIGFRATEEAWMLARPDWTRTELDACRDLPFVDADALERTTRRFLSGEIGDGQRLFRLIVYRRWVDLFGVDIR